MRTICLLSAALLLISACDLVNPARPEPYPDTTLFGNLLEADTPEGQDSEWTVTVRIGVPRVLAAAEEAEGKPTPTVDKGVIASVEVGPETTVVVDGRPALVEDLAPGTEVAVVPVPGTTRMIGTEQIEVDAAMLLDFASFRRWQLPRLGDGGGPPEEDPAKINSAGMEKLPFPIGDGTVLYFVARLRPPAEREGRWSGARRDGLTAPGSDARPALSRSYRTELGDDGWSAPEPVVLPGTEAADSVEVTWVADDETSCLATVLEDGAVSVVRSKRRSARDPWGEVEAVETIGPEARTPSYLAGSATRMVFAAHSARGDTDLMLWDSTNPDTPAPLEPRINTSADEWAPRVGPDNELLFMRADRQLALWGGELTPLRLEGHHRTMIREAIPTGDRRWIFFTMPRYTPAELDLDIFVSEWLGKGRLGTAVPADEWRPGAVD